MQENSAEEGCLPLVGAVQSVSVKGVADMAKVYSDLVGSARGDGAFKESKAGPPPQHPVFRKG